MDYRCFFCFTKSFEKLIEGENLDAESKRCFTRDMAELYHRDNQKISSPQFSREMHVLLKSYTGNPDPYKEEKRIYNNLILDMYSDFEHQICDSEDQFNTALRLAIAGNIIDYAADSNFDFPSTVDYVMNSEFAIDHSERLKKAIGKAETILYIGDNAGEIVFDKLFLELLAHSNIYYAVRGAPVINDVTLADAEYVGMDGVAKVISNGYDAPSTILQHCSPEFVNVFNHADLIISKGQGNLEGLYKISNRDIFYLLMVKCDVIAGLLNVKKGDFVVSQNHIQK